MGKDNFLDSVLITGANRGIGLGLVNHYLIKGLTIVATSQEPENSTDLLQLQKDYGNKLLVLRLDVTNEESIASFINKLKERQVTFSLVINNAGISIEGEFGEWTSAMFIKQFSVNTIGPALIAQAIAPFLHEGSKMVQISSGMGSLAWNINPENALDAYAVSKCALNMITRRLAEKLRSKGVIVFSMNPGWVKTEMGGQEAPTTIEDAIQNMVATINKVTIKKSGRFLSETAEIIPW
ncbi:MAG: SDR family oxidoreductase [Maribacter sp.]